MRSLICAALLIVTAANALGEILELPVVPFKQGIGPTLCPDEIIISGTASRIWHLTSNPKGVSEVEIMAEISSGEVLSNVRISLVTGKYDTSSFVSAVLFSTAVMSHPVELPRIVVGSTDSSATICFYGILIKDGQHLKLYNHSILISTLLAKMPKTTP